ncbi:MAG: TlpA disulfide reductase family protein [Terriglobales bacterium]
MTLRWSAILVLLTVLAQGEIVDDVRINLSQGNFSAASSQLDAYRAQHGIDPEYLDALSWMARASLFAQQLDQAGTYAKQIESASRQLLQHRTLDAEPHLPMALGAALEVKAQVLQARGQNAQAAAVLRTALATYGNTSIRARLQKNLNLLGLIGQPAPPLSVAEYLGTRPTPLTQQKGSPVLLFFWAHWCADCKQEGPIISRLTADFAAQGLKVEAPTQLYGYAAQGENAKPKDEVTYIGRVWQHYYPALQDVPVPISRANFDRYGASTTPTLVLIDRQGRVALYHPGLMSYNDLRAAIERTM